MKLQIAFDLTDLDKALAVAELTEKYADIIEVGSLLIYKHGELAVRRFKEKFPQKTILADAKIADQGKEAITLFAQAGADWITVMAGTGRNVIHTVCTIAHELNKKVMLDLIDASSLGQSALEAKSLGADALLFHKPTPTEDEQIIFADRWEIVKGNTQLPVFITGNITRENVTELLSLGAAGLIVSRAITHATDPDQEAAYLESIMCRC
jgi:3-hexulose-6-phosphate synthase